jgi:hypothetical protein
VYARCERSTVPAVSADLPADQLFALLLALIHGGAETHVASRDGLAVWRETLVADVRPNRCLREVGPDRACQVTAAGTLALSVEARRAYGRTAQAPTPPSGHGPTLRKVRLLGRALTQTS